MADDPIAAAFFGELQHALNYLYDPVQLQKSPLIKRFYLGQKTSPPTAFRLLLTDAVVAMQPEEDVPAHSNVSRYYHLLYQRYIEQFTQQEVAADMGLSVRQLRRLEKQALSMLAEYLWTRRVADKAEPANGYERPDDEQRASGETATPSWAEELAWSQKTIPNQPAQVADLITSTLKTMSPLVLSLGLEIELDIPEHLSRLDVQVVAVRQAFLNVLTTIARQAPGVRLTIQATPQDETVLVEIQVEMRENKRIVLERNDKGSLRMAAELVELSGGRLEVMENGAGKDRPHIQITLPTEQQVTVLAIDDNPDTLLLLQRYSAGTLYNLVGVRDPHQFVALAEELSPQIMVVDIMLPDIDGWELLGQRAWPIRS